MIDFLRALRAHAAYGQRMLGFVPALAVSELFYKFHSFSLECVAFLGTWLAIGWIASVALGPLLRRKGAVKSSAWPAGCSPSPQCLQ